MKKTSTLFTVAMFLNLGFNTFICHGQTGSLDYSFSTDGMVTPAIGSYDYGKSVAIQSDGKIVLTGYSSGDGTNYNFATLRFLSNGTLDNTFGTGGMAITDIATTSMDFANAMTIQSDGKIVAGGTYYNGSNYDFALTRYNTNGTLDVTFDTDGKVTTTVSSQEDNIHAMAQQSDGKIVVCGITYPGTYSDFIFARYNTNGTLDNTFGTNGIVTLSLGAFNDICLSMAIQTDGKIIGVGTTSNGTTNDIVLVRYNTNGTLDNTFGSGGIVTTAIGTDEDYVRSVALQTDGKIVVTGATFGTKYNFATLRYNTNGTLDNTFDSDGIVTTSLGTVNDQGAAVAIQSDGKIVVGGLYYNGTDYDFAAVRYTSSGALDISFDGNGILSTDINGAGFNDIARDIAIQPADGKIVLAGYYDYNSSSLVQMSVARYCPRPVQPSTISGSATVCAGTTQTYSIAAVSGANSYTWTVPSGSTINSGQGTTSISVTLGTSSGNVSVTADNDCGSSSVQTKAITVSNIPSTPGGISGSSAMCEGTTQTYSISAVSGATSYTWTVPAGTVINSGQGTTSISVTIGYASGNIEVTANSTCGNSTAALLPITISPLPTTFWSWSSVGLNVTFGNLSDNENTYAWDFGDAGTSTVPNPIHTYATGGTYTVELTTFNACGSHAFAKNITISTSTNGGDVGIEEIKNSLNLNVFPNPTSGIFKVTIEGESLTFLENYKIEIYNYFGQIIHQQELKNQESEIDLRNFSDGIYFVKCISPQKAGMVKILKQ